MRSYSKKCSYVDQFSNQDSLWGIPDYAVLLGAISYILYLMCKIHLIYDI